MSKNAYLEIIVGPMFSGKTTRLVDIYDACLIEGKSVFVINYSADIRYSNNMLSTHDKRMIPCLFSQTLNELWNIHIISDIHTADVILINEGQFFEDLYEVVTTMVEKYNKKVYVCGLDGDFRQKKFGQILDLIPVCDKVTKLASSCHLCNDAAIYSHRITSEESQVVIGSSNYIPLCRKCNRGKP